MGELRFPGLATGIDTAAIIKQLMIVNSRRLAKYQVQKTGYETQNTALGELRSKVNILESASNALADIDTLEVFSITSSDTDILTLSASSEAEPGSHSIEVNQLATTETWIQDTSTFDYKTDYVGGGTFIYSYNHQERTITTVADETTLEDLVGMINNDEDNPGVTASLLHQGGKYHLMLSGQETGGDYRISINSSSTEVWASSTASGSFNDNGINAGLTTKITELDEFSIGAGLQGDEKITINGKNHFGTDLPETELSVTANTTVGHLIDAINDRFDGVATARLENGEIYITDHISGTSLLQISLAYDNGLTGDTALTLPAMAVSTEGGGTSESLASLVSTSFIQTQSAQSSKIKVDGYPSTVVAEEQRLTLGSVTNGGTFTLTYNGETTGPIAYNAATATIQTALEALTNVTAGDITVGGDRLDENSAGYTSFTFTGTAGNVKMISIDTGSLSFSGVNTAAFTETTKGNDGYISRNSNSVSDAMSGITLNLHDVTAANETVGITISRNTGAVSGKVQHMVDTYNALMTILKEKTGYNAETKKMGILSDDIAVSFNKAQTRGPFTGIITGFVDTIDSFVQASDIGLSIDGTGMMEFDTNEFNDAVNKDYIGVLETLGATKSGNSNNTAVQFYNSSDKYTTAGTYNVKVTVAGNAITEAMIKLSTESAYHDVNWVGGLISGDSTFDDNGDPVFAENGLQLTVDLSTDGTYGTDEDPVIINVKQGMAGALEDLLEQVLDADGRLDTSKETLDNKITAMGRRIKNEEKRLNGVETRLINKFARLEKTLAMMQQQMGAVSMVSTVTFGS